MKIYDISQEIFGCTVYPGDPAPVRKSVCATARGDLYNLTAFSMCAHNGTHIDAPFHFLPDGKTVGEISLEKTVGPACVVTHNGPLSGKDAEHLLETVRAMSSAAAARILIKGDACITPEAAETFAHADLALIGVESQSVGDIHAPMAVHKILLARDVVLLEGLRLSQVEEGAYFLSAAPLHLGGADGAPCRALLVQFDAL